MLEHGPDAVAPWESVDSREARLMQEAISAVAYSLWRSRAVLKQLPMKTGLTREKF